GEVHRQRGAAAETHDVDVAVTRGELLLQVAFGHFDAIVATDAEGATDNLADDPMLGAHTLVEELGAGVEILEPDHIGVLVVPPGVLLRVPGAIESVQRHNYRLPAMAPR